MPPTLYHRPQTLREAKKAYRKSSATVRLSESELAVIERRAVLQERADRIKEREARRKANIKRRDEKIQREREARQRMGMPSPVKGGIHVGPSQLHLGDFMAMGVKRKRDDTQVGPLKVEKGGLVEMPSKSRQVSAMGPPPPRSPLQAVPANPVTSQGPQIKAESIKTEKENMRESYKYQAPSCTPPPVSSTYSSPKPKSLAKTVNHTTLKAHDNSTEGCRRLEFMGPPPLPNYLQSKSTAQQRSPVNAPQDNPQDTIDDSWEDFFVSNTQIVRELSPPPTKTLPTVFSNIQPPSKPPPTLPTVANDDTSTLLNLLSTQDLDFSDPPTQIPAPRTFASQDDTSFLLLQISTQDLDFSTELELTQAIPIPAPRIASSDFDDDDLTEEDLGDLALELDMDIQSSRESRESQCQEAQLAAEESDAFQFSTQDLRELGS